MREPGARVRDRIRRHAEAGPRIAVPHRWETPAEPGARRTPGSRNHHAVGIRPTEFELRIQAPVTFRSPLGSHAAGGWYSFPAPSLRNCPMVKAAERARVC